MKRHAAVSMTTNKVLVSSVTALALLSATANGFSPSSYWSKDNHHSYSVTLSRGGRHFIASQTSRLSASKRRSISTTKQVVPDIATTARNNTTSLSSSNKTSLQQTSHKANGQQQNKDNNEQEEQELSLLVARGILLLVAAIWGTNFASVKYLEQLCFHPPCSHPPSEFAFARFGVAALVSLPLLFRQPLPVVMAGLECGFWIAVGYATQAMALSTISAGKCAFICSLTVIVVPIIALILYGRPIRAGNVLAAVLALSGVAVLEGMVDFNQLLGISAAVADTTSTTATLSPVPEISSALAQSTTNSIATAGPLATVAKTLGVGKGDIIALGQPIGFGYCFLRIEYYQEKFKDVPNRVLTIAAAQCVAVGLLSVLWVLNDYNWVFPDFGYLAEPHRVAAIAWTGIVTTVFAIFLEGIALQKATATDAAIIFSSEPVWASLFGFLLLHEQLSQNSYIGGAIILTACLLGALSDMEGDENSFGDALDSADEEMEP